MKWTDVEAEVVREVVPSLIQNTRKVVMRVDEIDSIPDPSLKSAVVNAWRRESRHPTSLSFALRAAFKHKRLFLFRAGGRRGQYFVTAVQPAPLDAEHVIESIREVLMHLREHPGCNREELVSSLRAGESPNSEAGREVLAPLGWMIERGHIIEFHNGTLSVPLAKSHT